MEDRTVVGIVLLVIGFLGLIVFFPTGWMGGMMGGGGGMMGGWWGMMGSGMMPYGGYGGLSIVSFLFSAIFLGIFFLGLYLVLKGTMTK